MQMILRHHQKLPLLNYRKIGEITVQWNLVEVYLQTIVWHYLGLDYKRGRLLTYGLNARQKIGLFKSLTSRWIDDPTIKTKIRLIAKAANTLCDKRNEIVHGIWGYENDPKELYLLQISNIRQRVIPAASKTRFEDLQSTVRDVVTLKNQLLDLHKNLGVAIP